MKITEKPIQWRGSSLKDIKDEKIFSSDARKETGHQLSQVKLVWIQMTGDHLKKLGQEQKKYVSI